uniref:liprin-alpha-3-like n=1 Tax=Jaculus jaculus TaxID=51337 RepID=UPI001E1B5379|nr:liprin-alpha-3-like [Jaculus jaculus]
MCEVTPTFSGEVQHGSLPGPAEAGRDPELLLKMVFAEMRSMLETMREVKGRLATAQLRVRQLSQNDNLKQQLSILLPELFEPVTKKLIKYRKQLLKREEEIAELKAERDNMRLLLERLKYMVSKQERSLHRTFVQCQAQSSAGVSSEIEMIKKLKVLFRHHRVLEEKVLCIHSLQTLANGMGSVKDTNGRIAELQEALEQHQAEVCQLREGQALLRGQVGQLEQELATAHHQLNETKEANRKLQQELKELSLSFGPEEISS